MGRRAANNTISCLVFVLFGLTGCGDRESVAPLLAVRPMAVDFGDVPLKVGKRLPVTLQGRINDRIEIESVEILGGLGASGWLRVEGVPMVIAPAELAEVDFVLRAEAVGPLSGTVRFQIAGGEPTDVLVTALVTDAQLAWIPNSWDFGELPVGETATTTVELVNLGPSTATVAAIDLTPVSVGFLASIDGIQIMPVGARAQVTLTFSPLRTGRARAVARANAEEQTGGLALSGSAHELELEVSPRQMNFLSALVDSPQRRTMRLRNIDRITRTVIQLGVSEELQGELTFPGTNLPVDLGPGETVDLPVEFLPRLPGTRTGTISVETVRGVFAGPVILASVLGNDDTLLQIDTTTVSFGSVELSAVGRRRLRISNPTAFLRTVSMQRVGDTSFRVAGEPSVTLTPSDFTFIDVQFEPAATGAVTAELVLQTSGLAEQSVLLEATGGGGPRPDLLPLPATIDFGRFSAIRRPQETLRLHNVGTAPLTNVGAQLVDSDFGRLQIEEFPPLTINPGEFFDLHVRLTPQTASEIVQGLLQITSDDPDTPVVDIDVTALPEGFDPLMTIELSWPESADLDLHLLTPRSQLFDAPGDLFSCYRQLPAPLGQARLDQNAVGPNGYESIWLESPRGGTYRAVVVHAATATRGETARATITVTHQDGQSQTVWRDLRPGQAWEASAFDATGTFGEPSEPAVWTYGDSTCR